MVRAEHVRKAAIMAFGLALGSGCAPHLVRPNEYRAWSNGFVYGAFGQRAFDVRDICASGKAREVEVEQSAGTVLLTLFSLGLYTPRQVRVRCAP